MRKPPQQRDRDNGVETAEHYARLADDLGHRRPTYRAHDPGRPLSNMGLLLQPLSLFILSLLALAALGAVQMWRQGVFAPLFAAKGAVVDQSEKRWILNGRAPRAVDMRSGEPQAPAAEEPADDEE